MTPDRKPANLAASIRARLLNLARKRDEEFQLVLSDFATERLLYRLSISPYTDRFILKGAMLFRLWSADRHRATWDLDLLGRGIGSIETAVADFREICVISSEDGLSFERDSIDGSEIRVAEESAGVRVKLVGNLADAASPCRSTSVSVMPSSPRRTAKSIRRSLISRRPESLCTRARPSSPKSSKRSSLSPLPTAG
jgi:hypothetical protein